MAKKIFAALFTAVFAAVLFVAAPAQAGNLKDIFTHGDDSKLTYRWDASGTAGLIQQTVDEYRRDFCRSDGYGSYCQRYQFDYRARGQQATAWYEEAQMHLGFWRPNQYRDLVEEVRGVRVNVGGKEFGFYKRIFFAAASETRREEVGHEYVVVGFSGGMPQDLYFGTKSTGGRWPNSSGQLNALPSCGGSRNGEALCAALEAVKQFRAELNRLPSPQGMKSRNLFD